MICESIGSPILTPNPFKRYRRSAASAKHAEVEVHATDAFGSIERNNLDRVTEVWFGLSPAAFTYDAARFTLTAIVPADPNTTSGPITLIFVLESRAQLPGSTWAPVPGNTTDVQGRRTKLSEGSYTP